jgi:hypothetical protein
MLSWTDLARPSPVATHRPRTADFFQRLDDIPMSAQAVQDGQAFGEMFQREVVRSFIGFGLADFVQSKSQLPRRTKLASDRSASV